MRVTKVLATRDSLLNLAGRLDLESDEFVMGMAEALGVIAARLDEQGGFPCSLDDRLDAFAKAVTEAYRRTRNAPRVALVN